jgi:hypothetical protein
MATDDAMPDRMICYCFNIKLSDYKKNPALKESVLEKTRAGECSCKTMNPSGNCCLKDFPPLNDQTLP